MSEKCKKCEERVKGEENAERVKGEEHAERVSSMWNERSVRNERGMSG